jgi:hypothetical protein
VSYSVIGNGTIKIAPSSPERKHPGYKPPDSFRKQTQDPEIKNLYPMKLAPRIYPWGQCFNSLISNLKSIDEAQGSSVSTTSHQTAAAWPGFLTTQKQVTITLRLMNIIKKFPVTGTKE